MFPEMVAPVGKSYCDSLVLGRVQRSCGNTWSFDSDASNANICSFDSDASDANTCSFDSDASDPNTTSTDHKR